MKELFDECFARCIKDLGVTIYDTTYQSGFWNRQNNPLIVPTKLCLIHSEVSEAMEADRIGDRVNFGEELADVVIRVIDLATVTKVDLAKAIVDKVRMNQKRPRMHGGKGY